MGVKIMRKAIAVLIVSSLVLTSGIGVFAADSPDVGKIGSLTTVVNVKDNTITLTWTAAKNAKTYSVYVDGKEVASGITGTTYVFKGKANKRYDLYVKAFNESGTKSSTSTVSHRWIKQDKKVTAKKTGKRKVKVTWKKVKNAGKYRIKIYKNGVFQKYIVVSGKKTSKTITLKSKGKYNFRVVAMYKNTYYKSEQRRSKVITIK
jgi:hypothetical protein